MATAPFDVTQMFCVVPHFFPCILPALMISMGYINLGKWIAAFDGGARFGFDLVPLVIIFNCTAILCQYLATRIGVISGKNLAEICSEEYCRFTCIFLGIQAELSMIASDLTMIMGIASGLNLLFGMDLFICIYLSTIFAVLFPLLIPLLDICKAEVLYISISGFSLFFYVLGVLVSQPEIPLSMNRMFPRLSGESSCSLMALLGSNIMAHNFYIHSSIVQQQRTLPDVAMGALLHDHFFAILFIFSGIFLVNNVLMSSAAVAFDSAGLVVLSIQDAFYMLDQTFRNPIAQIVFFLVLFFSSQITALTRNLGGQVVWNHLLGMHLPFWVHHVAVKVLVITLVLCSAIGGGAEGLYQLLIYFQVILAMLLPSSVIPLFRVASLRSIMGTFKISWHLEILAFSSFLGMLVSNSIFIIEMLFGNSSWVVDLRGNTGNSVTLFYVIFLLISSASLCLTLHLAVTPLKSASDGQDMQVLAWDFPDHQADQSESAVENDLNRMRHDIDQESAMETVMERSTESQSAHSVSELNLNPPETIFDSDYDSFQSAHSLDHAPACTFLASPTEEPKSVVEKGSMENLDKVYASNILDAGIVQEIKPKNPVENDFPLAADVHIEKDEEEGNALEPGESSGRTLPTTCSEGSICNDAGLKGNDVGYDISRKVGLGRAGRRQFSGILDEFWGNVFDFHGQLTQEAKSRRIGVLLGMDLKTVSDSEKVDTTTADGSFKDIPEAEKRPVFPKNSRDFDSKQLRIPGMDSTYGAQMGSTSWSPNTLDSYVQSSYCNLFGPNERCYSSLYLPQCSDYRDHQPTTRHGFPTSFYQEGVKNSHSSSVSMDVPPTSKSVSSFMQNYSDPLTFILGQKELGSPRISGLQSPEASGISRLQVERSHYEPTMVGPSGNVVPPSYAKKYHSLPDISGLAISGRNLSLNDRNGRWGGLVGPQQSLSRIGSEYLSSVSRAGVPLSFDELSPVKLNRDALSVPLSLNLDSKSLWSRQPFEQIFAMAPAPKEVFSYTESEVKLLQSLKFCIMKLLKLEGSDWLFAQNGGPDEKLIDQVAAKERSLCETASSEMNPNFDADLTNSESLVPNCGESCIWRAGLVVSFGVWCIRRILELALIESRPELWGKYTFVLNRLQGILDTAFSKPRAPLSPCQCLEIPSPYNTSLSLLQQNGRLQAKEKPIKGECTTAIMIFEIAKRVEAAISGRKGRAGTAAGDIAFPKGKENLASVIKRYKRRLSSNLQGRPKKVPH